MQFSYYALKNYLYLEQFVTATIFLEELASTKIYGAHTIFSTEPTHKKVSVAICFVRIGITNSSLLICKYGSNICCLVQNIVIKYYAK